SRFAESESVLDPKGELLLKWRVDYDSQKIRFQLIVSDQAPSFNWFALGFSDRGLLNTSDDMHADAEGKLIQDRKQNCDNFHLVRQSQSIVFERYFDTCDDDDYVIEDGTVHVVWAHGIDKLFTSKGLCLTCISPLKRGFIRVRLHTPSGLQLADAYKLRIANKDLKVPGGDTTYWCQVVKLPEFISEKEHHIVQVKAAWAMGALPFTYPKEAGLPLGGPKANKYVMLEVHYNNPQMRTDWVDSSGIVLHVIGNKRKHDAAIMELGLEYTDKMAIPGGQKAFPLTAYCIPQCTGVGLPAEGIVVFGSQLHTHLTGIAVWTRHSRQGVELPVLNKDIHYSTHFQEIRILHRPVRVLPGDFLMTTCVYNTEDKDNATIGGHAITDEMCVNYVHYYPATDLEVCKSAVSNAALENYFNFEERDDSPNKSGSHLQIPSPIITRRNRTASTVEGEYVPLPGDEVIYRLCPIPPKFEKNQAVHVCIMHLIPEKHLKWDEPGCN
ncbi:Tyramine beta hydroxylase, partial [Operophtera brumata]